MSFRNGSLESFSGLSAADLPRPTVIRRVGGWESLFEKYSTYDTESPVYNFWEDSWEEDPCIVHTPDLDDRLMSKIDEFWESDRLNYVGETTPRRTARKVGNCQPMVYELLSSNNDKSFQSSEEEIDNDESIETSSERNKVSRRSVSLSKKRTRKLGLSSQKKWKKAQPTNREYKVTPKFHSLEHLRDPSNRRRHSTSSSKIKLQPSPEGLSETNDSYSRGGRYHCPETSPLKNFASPPKKILSRSSSKTCKSTVLKSQPSKRRVSKDWQCVKEGAEFLTRGPKMDTEVMSPRMVFADRQCVKERAEFLTRGPKLDTKAMSSRGVSKDWQCVKEGAEFLTRGPKMDTKAMSNVDNLDNENCLIKPEQIKNRISVEENRIEKRQSFLPDNAVVYVEKLNHEKCLLRTKQIENGIPFIKNRSEERQSFQPESGMVSTYRMSSERNAEGVSIVDKLDDDKCLKTKQIINGIAFIKDRGEKRQSSHPQNGGISTSLGSAGPCVAELEARQVNDAVNPLDEICGKAIACFTGTLTDGKLELRSGFLQQRKKYLEEKLKNGGKRQSLFFLE